MSKPSYYDISQPEVLEVIIQNRQNEISQLNSNVSALQSLLASGPLDTNALLSTLQHYEKKRQNYIAKTEQLVTDRDNLKDPTKEQLDRINSEIDFYTEQKNRVTNDIIQIKSQRQETKESLRDVKDLKENIIKLEIELGKFKKLKVEANYFKELYRKVHELGDPEKLLEHMTDPDNPPLYLPFLERLDSGNKRFNKRSDGKIEFFPRERLQQVIEEFEENLNDPFVRGHMLHGTVGAGKSHILLATACYYMRRGDHVIYFNKAISALDITIWKSKLMFLLFQESRKSAPDTDFIRKTELVLCEIDTKPRIDEFLLALFRTNGPYLRLFIDQMNTLGRSDKEKPLALSKLLFERYIGKTGSHYLLSSSGNDDDTYKENRAGTEIELVYIPIFPGFTTLEFNKWVDRCIEELEKANESEETIKNFIESKDKIKFVTGAVPLYLRLYFSVLQPTYEKTLVKLKAQKDITKMKKNIDRFYESKLIDDRMGKYRQYAALCLTNSILDNSAEDYILQRYFYVLDGEIGKDEELEQQKCCSCNLAAEFVAGALRDNKYNIDWNLDHEYLMQMKSTKDLVAKLEEYGLQKVLGDGLSSCGISVMPHPSIKLITQPSQVELVQSGSNERIYYKALRQNFAAIDGLYLTKDKIVGVNFTMNANHSDPFLLFTKILKKIPGFETTFNNYEIYFCWMTTSNCDGKLFVQKSRKINGLTFKVRVESFGADVEAKHEDLVREHQARVDELMIAMSESRNTAPNAGIIHPDPPPNRYNTRSNTQQNDLPIEQMPVENTSPSPNKHPSDDDEVEILPTEGGRGEGTLPAANKRPKKGNRRTG